MADAADSPVLRDTFDLSSRILFAFLVSVSTIVFLVIAFHLYVRFVHRRRQARRRHQAFLGRIRSLGLNTSGESPLDPAVINSLPIFQFKQTTGLGEIYHNGKSTECSVCLTMLEEEDMARVLPNCRHIFHAECIDKWLSLHSTCPLCRVEAEPRVKPEAREGPSTVMDEHSLGTEGSMSRVELRGEERKSRPQDLERQ
ncbi:putative hydrolase [Hibiscus syriacus]|uniref:RING-type E3 ubiquitin transferase n=1 Tax=Hibiscus syriacus TaxID=106335 RepID=A0A6A3CQR0_HIBSY|nr:E3 ubiquitin-protein ligase ATL41-like [Hibiscus syriacus]KAE8730814.1 putative hydrolase [Hibiscus syriacus]